MKNYYGLHGKLTAAEGKGAELASILLEAASLVGELPGCKLYMVSQDHENADWVWITEAWERQEDHAASLQLDSVRELITKARPILGGPPEGGAKLTVLGGTGLG